MAEQLLKKEIPVLPPPKEAVGIQKPRRHILQRVACLVCATVSTLTLALCGIQKLDEMLAKGFWQSVSEALLTGESDTGKPLSEHIGETAFGPLTSQTIDAAALQAPLALPRIYYIPKEEIVDKSYAEKEKLEKQMFDLYAFDYAKVPSGAYPIVPTDLSANDAQMLKNDTNYDVDMTAIAKAAENRTTESIPKEPLVLIVHTHGTESFSAEDSICYGDDFNHPRSEDVSKNIVAVGKVLADALNSKGIPTLHCETMHDKDSYISAYTRSAESIRHYLEKYPSIRYVFDVHRDSLIRSDLTKLRPVTLRDGKPCAQLMMIIGSDEKGAGEYDWQSNLVLAQAIQQNLCDGTLGVARQLYLRGATYNQQYAQYGLLLEIGACGNSLSEAKNAALAFADAFEKVLKDK